MVSLIGTGLTDTGKQSIRFTFGKYKAEVGCSYDQTSDSYYCTTPNFDNVTEETIYWPQEALVEITLDGNIYLPCEQKYMIYCIYKKKLILLLKNLLNSSLKNSSEWDFS